jgi:hypothetical protein
MKKTLLLAAMTAAFAGSANAALFQDFKVNESVISTADTSNNNAAYNHGNFVADKLNGAYEEKIQFLTPTTFSASAFATFDGYRRNNGVTPIVGEMNGYSIYAIFQATGTAAPGFKFTGTSGSFSLYVDRNQDSEGTVANGYTAATVINTSDDELIGSATAGFGKGDLLANPGAYSLYFTDFQLTAFGSTYWYEPAPFYNLALSNGDNDQLVSTGVQPGEFLVTGDTSLVFPVSEPESLALVGLGLVGLAMVRRRKSV